MNVNHVVLPFLIVVASAGALFETAIHTANTPPSDHHQNTVVESHNDYQFDHHDDVAIEDMLHHAAMHLDAAVAVSNSYVALPTWKPTWELRWMDFRHGDHVVRLYHATDHSHPETRYIVAIDDAEHGVIDDWIPLQ